MNPYVAYAATFAVALIASALALLVLHAWRRLPDPEAWESPFGRLNREWVARQQRGLR